MEMSEVVLYAMYKQAEAEGRHLIVEADAVGRAMADVDLYERHVHLSKADGGRTLRVQFG
jgi:hypothetical protein